MDDTVFIIVGHWRCEDDGQWTFKIKKDVKIRSVPISQDLSFDQLRRLVIKAFRLDTSKTILHLSFWSPDVSNLCTQTRLPPVAIESDSDVVNFVRVLSSCSGMNIFASFEDKDAVEVVKGKVAEEIVDIPSPTAPVSEWSFDDVMLDALDKVEAAYLKKSGKRPVDEVVCPKDNPFNIVTEPDVTTFGQSSAQNDPDYHFNELARLVEKDIYENTQDTKGTMDRQTNRSCFRRPIPSSSAGPGFSLGIEGLDGVTPFSLVSAKSGDTSDFAYENEGIPSYVDETHPLFNDPPPMMDNLTVNEDDEEIFVGRVFESKGDLHKCLAAMALQKLFCYRINKSCRKRVVAVCVDRLCPWRVYATSQKDEHKFEVKTYSPEQSCNIQSRARFGEKATSRVLAELVLSKYANGKTGPRACELPDLIRCEHNINISYTKALHAKEVALARARGNEEHNFKILTSYLQLLRESNPGTITELSTIITADGITHFKFLFFSFGASLAGVPFLRKVVVIDGTQLKGKYKGCLVTASSQDGNMQIFSLAFGVVDFENEKSWVWFLENLTKVIPDAPDLVFISDRCPSIYTALSRVYPKSMHGACTVHLYRNIKAKFKSEALAAVFSKAARAYTMTEFYHWWADIEFRSPACAKWLTDIGFEHWSLSHFKGNRYNLMSSNIAESVNAALLKSVEYPIVTMVEFIRNMAMKWFSLRRTRSNANQSRCTPVVEGILLDHHRLSVNLDVSAASQWIYQVTDSPGNVVKQYSSVSLL